MTESPDAVTISVPVEACECGGMNGHHEICPVAYAEMIEQYRQVVAERDAAVVRAEGAEVAWTDTITERDEALAVIERVRDYADYLVATPEATLAYVPVLGVVSRLNEALDGGEQS